MVIILAKNFFVYLDRMSISTFTKSFLIILERLVSFKVCGITLISKYRSPTLERVNETPLIAIEAFSTKYLINFLFSRWTIPR